MPPYGYTATRTLSPLWRLFQDLDDVFPPGHEMGSRRVTVLHVLIHVLGIHDQAGIVRCFRIHAPFRRIVVGGATAAQAPVIEEVDRVQRQRVLDDENARPPFPLQRLVDPALCVERLGILRVRVAHDDIRTRNRLRAVCLGGLAHGRVMRIDDVARKHTDRPELLVVHDLHAEIHSGQAGRLHHVQPHFVPEDPHRTGRLRLPQKHVVVIIDRINMGNTRQNGFRASAVARIRVDLDPAQRDFQVRGHEGLIDKDSIFEARRADFPGAEKAIVVDPGILRRRLLPDFRLHFGRRHRAVRREGSHEQNVLVANAGGLQFRQDPRDNRVRRRRPRHIVKGDHHGLFPAAIRAKAACRSAG